MAQITSRRSFLATGTATMAMPASLAAAPARTDDAQIIAAAERWHQADKITSAAQDARDEASFRLHQLGPIPMPEELFERHDDKRLGIFTRERTSDGRAFYGLEAVDRLRARPRMQDVYFHYPEAGEDNFLVRSLPWPKAQARADEIMAASDRWKAAHTAREEATGLRAAEDALAAANKVAWGIMAEITAMPATTLAGLIAKTIVARGDLTPDEMDSEISFEDFPCERLELSILRDLLALRVEA